MAELRGRWWNQKWGRISRCDIWLEEVEGQLRVRWRGREWDDRDGILPVPDAEVALAVVEKLIREDGGPVEDGGPWKELPLSLFRKTD